MTRDNIDYVYDCILAIHIVWVSTNTNRLYFETEHDLSDWVGCLPEEHDFYYNLITSLINKNN